jgi:hypothetical protein
MQWPVSIGLDCSDRKGSFAIFRVFLQIGSLRIKDSNLTGPPDVVMLKGRKG